jgi:AmmeMemoRadiSam system protein B
LKAWEILKEAASNYNACGAGAMAAAAAASKAMGSKGGVLLEHVTSYDVYPQGEFEMAVGYAGIIF